MIAWCPRGFQMPGDRMFPAWALIIKRKIRSKPTSQELHWDICRAADLINRLCMLGIKRYAARGKTHCIFFWINTPLARSGEETKSKSLRMVIFTCVHCCWLWHVLTKVIYETCSQIATKYNKKHKLSEYRELGNQVTHVLGQLLKQFNQLLKKVTLFW